MAEQEESSNKLRIFISYSRRDAAAADAMVTALTARGFEVKIDTRDLPFGEKWQLELAEFIRNSDTVIWLVSDASVQSKWVNWELDEVAKRNKRLVPVVVGMTAPEGLPRQLGEIHMLPVGRAFDPVHDLNDLVRVLETDHAWLKEASRLADRATEWLGKMRASALLLRGPALVASERWKDARPVKAPAPPPEVLDLILASRRAATQRQRWWIGGALAVALGASALAGVAVWQAQVADQRRQETVRLRQQTQATESGLLSQAAKEAVATDPGTAMLLVLEGMPDTGAGIDRPVVTETQFELDGALRSNREQRVLVHDRAVVSTVFSPDGKLLVTVSEDKTARLFEVASGKELARPAHDAGVNNAAFSPGGKLLATASDDGTARLFEVPSGKELARLTHDRAVVSTVFSPDGKLLATASDDGTARLFEVTSGKELARLAHDRAVVSTVFSPDGRLLATASGIAARLFEVASGKELARLAHDAGVSSAAFSPDGKLLATASGDTARLFEVVSGKELARLAHDAGVHSATFGPDGRLLATASGIAARLFEVASGKELARLAHDDEVWSAAFSPDGLTLATGYSNKIARLWRVYPTPQSLVDAAKAKAARCLTQAQRKQYFLPAAPPLWCVERRLWPYHSDNWQAWLPRQKAWLAGNRQGEAPALPKAE